MMGLRVMVMVTCAHIPLIQAYTGNTEATGTKAYIGAITEDGLTYCTLTAIKPRCSLLWPAPLLK